MDNFDLKKYLAEGRLTKEEEVNESASAAAIAASAAAIAANAANAARASGGGGGASNPWALLTLMVLFSLPVVGIAMDSGLGDKVRGWINRYKLNRVINRLRKDPEVLEFIKSKKPGIQNFLKSKLTDKEQKYIKQISWNKITKGEIREISNFLEEESIQVNISENTMENFDLKKYLAENKILQNLNRLKGGNIKTPMQELIEQLKEERDEHGYERGQHYETAIEFAESLLEKEKELMCGFATNFVEYECFASFEGEVKCDLSTEEYFDKIFNTK